MNNIKNYIKYYKDISFDESPFNDIDNIILSSIVYLDFKDIVKNKITLKDAGILFFKNINYKKLKNDIIAVKSATEIFELMFRGERYKNIVLSDYVKVVDKEKQFCAITYHIDDLIYVAYEGTDDSIIGWKEDFCMFYKFPVAAQQMAIDYINKVVKFYHHKVIIGGHSKGGNLAMCAYMYAKPFIKRRVIMVYNNDGLGFRKEQTNTKEYKEMLSKLRMIIPEESLVGLLLRHPENYIVIKSNSKGLYQHNLNSWMCYGPVLLKSQLSNDSKRIENWIANWLDNHNDSEREKILMAIFDVLDECDITSISQLKQFNINRIIKLIKASRDLDKESKELILDVVKVLFIKNKENVIE